MSHAESPKQTQTMLGACIDFLFREPAHTLGLGLLLIGLRLSSVQVVDGRVAAPGAEGILIQCVGIAVAAATAYTLVSIQRVGRRPAPTEPERAVAVSCSPASVQPASVQPAPVQPVSTQLVQAFAAVPAAAPAAPLELPAARCVVAEHALHAVPVVPAALRSAPIPSIW